jgi:hypothetical protein
MLYPLSYEGGAHLRSRCGRRIYRFAGRIGK